MPGALGLCFLGTECNRAAMFLPSTLWLVPKHSQAGLGGDACCHLLPPPGERELKPGPPCNPRSHVSFFPTLSAAVLHKHPQDKVGRVGWGVGGVAEVGHGPVPADPCSCQARALASSEEQGQRGQSSFQWEAKPVPVASARKAALGTGGCSSLCLSLFKIVATRRGEERRSCQKRKAS